MLYICVALVVTIAFIGAIYIDKSREYRRLEDRVTMLLGNIRSLQNELETTHALRRALEDLAESEIDRARFALQVIYGD